MEFHNLVGAGANGLHSLYLADNRQFAILTDTRNVISENPLDFGEKPGNSCTCVRYISQSLISSNLVAVGSVKPINLPKSIGEYREKQGTLD